MVTVSTVFILLHLIVGDFLFQLNTLTPSCSIAGVFEYIRCMETWKDDAPVEVQRYIGKRAMSLQVQFFSSLAVVVVSITAKSIASRLH
jgi:hypothetical protein